MDGGFQGNMPRGISFVATGTAERHAASPKWEKLKANKKRRKELEGLGWKTLSWIYETLWNLFQRMDPVKVAAIVRNIFKNGTYKHEKVGHRTYVSPDDADTIFGKAKNMLTSGK